MLIKLAVKMNPKRHRSNTDNIVCVTNLTTAEQIKQFMAS